jgi:O-antigen/teichoic acid export membrane protein
MTFDSKRAAGAASEQRASAITAAISSVINFLVFALAQMVITPLLISQAGSATLGEYAILTQIFVFLSLLDMGFVGAFQRSLSRSYGLSDWKGTNTLLRSGRIWLAGADFLRAAIGFLLVAFLELFSLANSDSPELQLSFATLSTWYLVRGFFAVYSPALISMNRMATNNYLFMISSISRLVISVSLIALGFGLQGMVLGIIISEILLGLGSYWFFSRTFGKVPFSPVQFSWSALRPVVIFGMKSFPIGLASACTLQSDSIIAGFVLGTSAVSILYTTKMPVLISYMLINKVVFSAIPSLYRLHAQKKPEKLASMYYLMHRYTFMMSLTAAFGLIMFHKRFISAWVGSDLYGGFDMTILFSIYVVLLTSSNLNGQFVFSGGNIRSFSIVVMIEAGFVIVLSYFFTLTFGIFGTILGILLAHTIGGVFLWRITIKELRIDTRRLISFSMAPPFVCAATAALLSYLLFQWAFPSNIATMMLSYIFFSAALGYFFVVSRDDAKTIRSLLNGIWLKVAS